jgi:uncharacterized membrane protein YdbT with pleckstrin-like domain
MAGPLQWLDPHVEKYLLKGQNEYVVYEVKKAWPASAWPWVRLFVAVCFLPFAWANEPAAAAVIYLLAGGVAAQALWRILEEFRDRFVVTNMRVFRVHGIFNIRRATVPLSRILDITVKKPWIGRLLNYGHFVFESAAQVQGLNEIRYVANVDKRDYELQQTMQRAGLRATATRPAEDDGT